MAHKNTLSFILPDPAEPAGANYPSPIGGRKVKLRFTKKYHILKELLFQVVQALSLTVEMRDPYARNHQERVARLAAAIARELRLPKEKVNAVRMAATVHDIGKIRIPAALLSKPGKIDALEFGIIKTHSQAGFDILNKIEFPWPVAQIVLQHHERLNGSGYPRGIKGEQIWLESRILAVADVVEAMVSHRSYRPAWGLPKALAEIAANRDVLYDASVVDACVRINEKTDLADWLGTRQS